MPQPIVDFYNSITTHNWFAVAAIALMVAIQVLKTQPWLAQKIWVKLPTGYRFLVPILGAMATAFVHGFMAKETLGASVWDALKIAFVAMGGNAALTESPLPWSGGAGGVPAPDPALGAFHPASPLPVIPPLADALDDNDKTPVDGKPIPPSDPPPNAA